MMTDDLAEMSIFDNGPSETNTFNTKINNKMAMGQVNESNIFPET